jgi:hypothetical protein
VILYCVTARHGYTMAPFLRAEGAHLSSRMRIVSYDSVLEAAELPVATYIFSDLERLRLPDLEALARVRDQLAVHVGGDRFLNHPDRSLQRAPLLSKLQAVGLNSYRVWRPSQEGLSPRFPVFLRFEHRHDGAWTDLLHTPSELQAALRRIRIWDPSLRRVLIVEYIDARSEEGSFVKYGCFNIGGRIVPRHRYEAQGWLVKEPDMKPEANARELEYIRTNPHEEQLREIFAVARIDYGRLDYGVAEGRIETWEINTNPGAIAAPPRPAPRIPTIELFAPNFVSALEELDDGDAQPATIQIEPGRGARSDRRHRGVPFWDDANDVERVEIAYNRWVWAGKEMIRTYVRSGSITEAFRNRGGESETTQLP